MYNNFAELCALASERERPLWELAVEQETALTGKSREQIFRAMEHRLDVMTASAERALKAPCSTIGGLIDGFAERQLRYSGGDTLCGSMLNRVMARAMSASEVNASMGRICAAPTAGACGIVPAVLLTVGEQRAASRADLVKALLTASVVGALIMKNATVSGAEGGCQAECGVAAAMAAAAAVHLSGGSNEQAVTSVAIALMNCMGLVCDPVAGLVSVPCIHRNSSQAIGALVAADMALAGVSSVIPADEVVDAMLRVGKSLPAALRETAQGGIAVSKTGREITQRIFG